MHDDEPKPKRRSALRHALGGLALLVCIGLSTWLLERAGLTNWSTWWRYVRTAFDDRRAARKKVLTGMSQEEVERQLGCGDESGFVTVSWCVKPGPGPVVRPPYPIPFKRVEYPEYGFDVVYSGGQIASNAGWQVVAVEDRK